MGVFEKPALPAAWRGAVALLLAASAGGAAAQTMYRCGNTYSQTPCAPDAVPQRGHADAATEKAGGAQGYDLCASHAPESVETPEPQSARVQQVGPRKAEVIQYAGQPIAAHRYDLTVDAKTAYGVYSGPRPYACWVSEDQRRILQFAPRRR
ncbi:hypothetical protein [Variovorax sp. YR752]|uniref:hypothetical protein n=1 Tax=Variovorax sp. YR752 TaxID=1884383 RepID=UPI003137D922